jgi:NAD(P)-dependent dehydrogenase (short-subunit alcohol dehydrogenase family)
MSDLSEESRGLAPGRGRLVGRRVLVVGAGQRASDEPDPPIGNGRAIAVLAAREGAAVACADVRRESAAETLARVEREGSAGVVIDADATDENDVRRMIEETVAGLGGIDGLVLNVGIGEGVGLQGTSVEQWERTFAVNLRAHFLACKAALPVMDPGGAIVFISSVAALKPATNIPAYDASKAALFALCRHVAREGEERRSRANVVVPGLIDTPLGRLATRGRPDRARTRIPLGRQGTAWEVAYATLFLLSRESDYVTGQTLVVDGGVSSLR